MPKIFGKKIEAPDIKKLCEKASKTVDDIDIIFGGIEWLFNSSEASKIISSLDSQVKKSIEEFKSSSKTSLRIGEGLIVSIDNFLVGFPCERMKRTSKKNEGINMMRQLFENVTDKESFKNVCFLINTTEKLLSFLIAIIEKILNNKIIVGSTITYVGGNPVEVFSSLYKMLVPLKTSFDLTKQTNKLICINLKKIMNSTKP